MVASAWLLGLFLGVIAAHAIVIYHVYRIRKHDTTPRTTPLSNTTDLVDTDNGDIDCPHCGTTNKLGYRYCRACVSELPTAMDFDQGPDAPFGRITK